MLGRLLAWLDDALFDDFEEFEDRTTPSRVAWDD